MKIDLCLIVAPGRVNSTIVPIGEIQLAAWLEQNGIKTEIIDVKRDKFTKIDYDKIMSGIVQKVREIQPEIIGLGGFSADYRVGMKLAESIKKFFNGPIIAGGIHATLMPNDFIYKNSPIDFAVIGEGEITSLELINALKKDQPVDEVDGIAYHNNGFTKTNPRSVIEYLDVLPMPAYHKIDMEYYTRPNVTLIRNVLLSGVHIFTGRGCPFNCTFCANSALWKTHKSKKGVRYRSIKSVVDEIEFLKKTYDIDGFYILDDTFTVLRDRVYEFCEKLLDQNLNLIWGAQTRVHLIDEKILRMLKLSGCIQLDFGVESGSQRSLNIMRKGITVEQTKKAFKMCKKSGFRTLANVMFNTPKERKDDVEKTVELLKEIKATKNVFMLTVPLLGTEIYDKMVEPKLIKDEYNLLEDLECYYTIKDPRFRLAEHNLNLKSIVKSIDTYYNLLTVYKIFSLNSRYLRAIFKSSRKIQYLMESIREINSKLKTHLKVVFGEQIKVRKDS